MKIEIYHKDCINITRMQRSPKLLPIPGTTVSYEPLFPLLMLPRDMLFHLMQIKFMDWFSARNLLLTCKTIHNSAPLKFRKNILMQYYRKLYRRNPPKPYDLFCSTGNRICKNCGTRYKYKHRSRHSNKCRGILTQCYICFVWIPIRNFPDHNMQGCQGGHSFMLPPDIKSKYMGECNMLRCISNKCLYSKVVLPLIDGQASP